MNDIEMLLPDIKLRFNLEHPDLEDCYAFGYECALSDIQETDNPFTEGSLESDQWLEGWWAGFYGEAPLFTLNTEAQQANEASAAANDEIYIIKKPVSFMEKVIELTSLIAVSAFVGYQVIDLVA